MSQLDRTLNKSKEYVNTLLAELPEITNTVKDFREVNKDGDSKPEENIDEITSNIEKTIDALKKIPLEIKQINGKPVQTVAFCGPSNSGKSTMFEHISGFNVPTGINLSTMSSLAIIPNELNDENSGNKLISDAENIFPNFELKPFESSEDVIKEDEPNNRLFVSSYKLENENNPINVVLIDLPDFNSIFDTNWKKAKLGISRADTVIFTISVTAYPLQSTIEILKEILSKAGSFVYLLTQVDPEDDDDFKRCAEEIRNHLLEIVSKKDEFKNIKNADGKSLVELLASCPFYYSPKKKSSPDKKIHIYKLENCNEEFNQIIFTGAVETIFESKFNKIRYSSEQALEHCEKLESIVKNQQKFLKDVDDIVTQTAKNICGSDESWPVPYVLTILREELNKSQSPKIREIEKYISNVFFYFSGKLKNAKKLFIGLFNKQPIKVTQNNIQAKFEEEADNCLKEIGLNINAPTKLNLQVTERNELIKEFMLSEPPHFGEWKEEVRKKITEWIEEQKILQVQRNNNANIGNVNNLPNGIILKPNTIVDKLKYFTILPLKKTYDLFVCIEEWLSTRTRLDWLKIINKVGGNILLPLGVLLIIVDYFFDGGMGELGLITLVGACPALTGALSDYLMQIYVAIDLGDEVEKARISWKELSIKSCKEFLMEKLIKPNILKNCMSEESIEKCLSHISKSKEACIKLQEILE